MNKLGAHCSTLLTLWAESAMLVFECHYRAHFAEGSVPSGRAAISSSVGSTLV